VAFTHTHTQSLSHTYAHTHTYIHHHPLCTCTSWSKTNVTIGKKRIALYAVILMELKRETPEN
jgi:hypothetical protein